MGCRIIKRDYNLGQDRTTITIDAGNFLLTGDKFFPRTSTISEMLAEYGHEEVAFLTLNFDGRLGDISYTDQREAFDKLTEHQMMAERALENMVNDPKPVSPTQRAPACVWIEESIENNPAFGTF